MLALQRTQAELSGNLGDLVAHEAEAAGQWNGEMAQKRSELTALVQAQGSAAAEESSRILLGAASRGNAFASTSSMCSSVAAPSSRSLPLPAAPPKPGGEQEV